MSLYLKNLSVDLSRTYSDLEFQIFGHLVPRGNLEEIRFHASPRVLGHNWIMTYMG